ncbi:MAG: TonB-dependent receptor [Hyphomicrobiales bacterium]|nr:TonB-dependent receptor [Hyphomicrobiales bacterium]
MTIEVAGPFAAAAVVLALTTISPRADTIVLPTFDVVATTPLNGGQINVSQSPFAVWQSSAQDAQTFNDTTLTDTLARSAPGVTQGNVSGNDFQPDLSYRGFDATAVTGTPQGLAVYQNGTRINEAFGDVVNWDLIPQIAIDKTTIIAANPIFGLNALGGAVTVTMKNGFTWQGFEADLEGGSFYRAQEQFQYGKQVGNYSVYIAASQINDGSWRVAGASQLTNFYGDVGYKANGFESHLQLTAGNTQFGAAAFTPVQLLQTAGWGSVYTIPQTTFNQMVMLQWNGTYAYSPTVSFQGGAYFRQFNQQHVDGNGTDVTPCDPSIGPFSCLNGSPVHDTHGNIIPDISQGGTLDLAEDDDNQTQSRTVGVSAQVVDTDKIFGRDNNLTVGTSLDYGWTHYTGNSQLGTIQFTGNAYPVTPSPFLIDEPDSFLNPIDVRANNTYLGVYGLDTFNATDRLTLTGGARFNVASINLEGTNDALLSGNSVYFHINPTVGFTYKITPDINFYGGYAMTNRTPTPLELGCASPTDPCIIDNFLSSDPPLKQVVGNTFELGFRGTNAFSQFGLGPQWGKLSWSAGLFRTTLTNDILPVVSTFNGFGFYQNVGTTLRQGAEVAAQWTGDRWSAYANYTYIDAIYLTTFEEPSPNNPLADANGNIPITNGTQIAGIPKNTVKIGVDYAVTPNWHIGADMVAASGQVIFGNENNAVPQVPGYAVFGLHTSYQWNKQVQIYGYAQNIFDQRYYTAGGLVQPGEFMTGPSITNPQSFGPAKPIAIYGGIRVSL